jgi:hypothetical protein
MFMACRFGVVSIWHSGSNSICCLAKSVPVHAWRARGAARRVDARKFGKPGSPGADHGGRADLWLVVPREIRPREGRQVIDSCSCY